MDPVRPVVQSASFVDDGAGPRLRVLTAPRDRPACGSVVFVHPFAEEMNKSRRMAARMARLLAGEGWRVAQRDLAGCGDSAGDFGDASWQAWIDDIDAELAATGDPAQPVWLWCLRAGALLAPAVAKSRPQLNLLLWQPVLSGAQHLQQFLRLHAGARIVGSAPADDGAPSPAQRLKAGETVEVGGYRIGPALATGLQQAGFALAPGHAGRVVALEVSADAAPSPSPLLQRLVEQGRAVGSAVEAEVLSGPPFWQTQEIEDCEPLLERTLARLRDAPQPAAVGGDPRG